jgi:hypothetical protein
MGVPGRRRGVEECAAVWAMAFDDVQNARLIYLAAGGLVLLGCMLIWLTVRWWRSTRVEHPVLAPLEVMGERSWRKSGDVQRSMALDAVRPEGADKLVAIPEMEDLQDDAVPMVEVDEFADLRDEPVPERAD